MSTPRPQIHDVQDHATKSRSLAEVGSRFLVFSLNEEEFAIPLLSVKEVIAMPEITPVPQTPPHFLGIMNLRGSVISVIDLRAKLGIKPKADTETAIIICDVQPNCVGIVVDSINSVINSSAEQYSEKPQIQSNRKTDYIVGIFREKSRLIFLLDINATLDVADHHLVQSQAKAS